ncbi:MAG: glycosyltransferase [Pseudomonadota bacterium]
MSNAKTLILTASDAKFLPAACCQIMSASQWLPSGESADLRVICCDVSDADVRDAYAFFDKHKVDAEIVEPDVDALGIKVLQSRWPRAAYLRLYLDRVFGDDYKRLIYFDADTRVVAPLDGLLSAELRGHPAAAVHDYIYYVSGNIQPRRQKIGLGRYAPYLQSGVMVFDWPKTLSMNILGKARGLIETSPDRFNSCPDQDALNAALEDRWAPLDPRWNMHELYLMHGQKYRPYITHFTSAKPWSRYRQDIWQNAAQWYREQLAGTAWEGFVEDQSFKDRLMRTAKHAKLSLPLHMRSFLGRRAPFILDLMGVSFRDQLLPWSPRGSGDVELMVDALVAEAEGNRPNILPPEQVLPRATRYWEAFAPT